MKKRIKAWLREQDEPAVAMLRARSALRGAESDDRFIEFIEFIEFIKYQPPKALCSDHQRASKGGYDADNSYRSKNAY